MGFQAFWNQLESRQAVRLPPLASHRTLPATPRGRAIPPHKPGYRTRFLVAVLAPPSCVRSSLPPPPGCPRIPPASPTKLFSFLSKCPNANKKRTIEPRHPPHRGGSRARDSDSCRPHSLQMPMVNATNHRRDGPLHPRRTTDELTTNHGNPHHALILYPPVVPIRGLHSFTSQLNLSAMYGIGGAHRGWVARVVGVLGGV